MASLTEDILDFAKIEVDMFNLNEKPFEIGDLIKEIEFIFENQWAQKGLWLRFECDEELRRTIFDSDSDRIRQIFMNLISNSFKFTLQGGITITIDLLIDNISMSRFLKIKVIDTGIGISKADSKGLFQVFGMIHKHRGELNIKGTGLGLTISQKLVKMLGGKIKMESTVGFGTIVTFTIKENSSSQWIEESKFANLEEIKSNNKNCLANKHNVNTFMLH